MTRGRSRLHWSMPFVLVLLLLAGAGSAQAPAQASQASTPEYQLKAVFLFNFAQFVQWPATAFEGPDSPLVIGVLGPDPFGGSLDEVVRGEKVQGRTIEVRHFSRAEAVDTCHILFVGRTAGSGLEGIFSELRSRPILTVGESDQFARTGGMIGFVTDRNRIRLRINRGAAEEANLQLSSRLLRPAEIVSTDGS